MNFKLISWEACCVLCCIKWCHMRDISGNHTISVLYSLYLLHKKKKKLEVIYFHSTWSWIPMTEKYWGAQIGNGGEMLNLNYLIGHWGYRELWWSCNPPTVLGSIQGGAVPVAGCGMCFLFVGPPLSAVLQLPEEQVSTKKHFVMTGLASPQWTLEVLAVVSSLVTKKHSDFIYLQTGVESANKIACYF